MIEHGTSQNKLVIFYIKAECLQYLISAQALRGFLSSPIIGIN